MDLLDPFWEEQDVEAEQDDLHGVPIVWSTMLSLAVFASLIML
jgi:hypothetical protein